MSIVMVPGVAKRLEGDLSLHRTLFTPLRQGLARAGVGIGPEDVVVVSYGKTFRPKDEMLSPQPYYDADDVEPGFEQDLLRALWERAADVDEKVVAPEAETLFRSPAWVQRALYALTMSAFWSGVGEQAFISFLKQVRRYFTDDDVRSAARAALAGAVNEDTRVIVAHSFGSVVAYESLCAHPEWPVETLVTLGSPLALRHIVYNRLRPPPAPKARWPGSVESWTNVTDAGDVIAVVEDVRPFFSDRITQIRLDTGGAKANDMRSYLTDEATGRAIAAGLGGGGTE
ncbi:hypothetical protein J4573_52615 [Actinomadura barringtoniae]|uniref:Alpha/beta hydrolase n=1 Tax=Actinomadura barringtoniae TaxID=1427535 RepID=A0A939PPK6_9ACTN|nr:hypothetical protein [Actinomadura barringtoniae]MBO2455803.1 hypothetical protein [Actinomadura barringtoniae]